ncbi:unnamed protein product [Mytilus edulis]|uniref:Chitin-binding type-2 domain-containing protein n=1 Tax=Mytilus edulis TaxID=6550 RepID=A0A8S3TGY4_MYTED|nr:unnamed protein product [Mytilus edulis]
MLRARQSSYVINNVDVGKTDLGNTVGYEECLDYVEKDDYDQIPADRDTINHDYLVLTSTVKEEMKQTNNMVHHQNKQSDSEIKQTSQDATLLVATALEMHLVQFHVRRNRVRMEELASTMIVCVTMGLLECEIDVNQTCKSDANRLIPHPNTCQLYYNCSQAVSPIPTWYRLYTHIPQVLRPAYLHECPYPELFSTTTMSCQNYTDVKCGSRYETKNKCDYLAVNYYCMGACKVCIYSFPDCVGFADGIHRNEYISQSSRYFECQNERNIYGGQNPCPSNMAPHNGKCTDLFEIQHVQHSNWQLGYAIDCSGRPNGNYKSEHVQKCDIYYTCVNGNSTLTYCDSELVFDSKSSFCQNTTNVCTPCGSVVSGC